MSSVTVDQWVDMFRAIDPDDATLHKWHAIFERRHPDAHQSFLEWFGFDESDIKRIRSEHVRKTLARNRWHPWF